MTWKRAAIILFVIAVIAWLLSMAPSWFWHPLGYCVGSKAAVRDCKGYNSWSGSFSDIAEVTLIASLISGAIGVRAFLHAHYECHEETCHRLGFHRVFDRDGKPTPYKTCWPHHPVLGVHAKHKVPLDHIHKAHGLPGSANEYAANIRRERVKNAVLDVAEPTH